MKQLFTFLLVVMSSSLFAQETVTFKAADGLTVHADFYPQKGSNKIILLFHQAGWSRGEYLEIAPKLNQLGFNCLAIDLRSGSQVNEVINQTNANAKKADKKTDFIAAYADVKAAVSYAEKTFANTAIILWGSSYSSSLVLKFAGDFPEKTGGVLSFSPGEYFSDKNLIKSSIKNIIVPTFITSSKNEKKNWWPIYESIDSSVAKKYYLPESKGNHGSRALWEQFDDHKGYWSAVKVFLQEL